MKARPLFREDKATQAAAQMIKAEGGWIDILKLVKLIYLADRQALLAHGRPITFDTFFSMVHGPVVGSTMDCINAVPDDRTAQYWSQYIGPRDEGHRVRLLRAAPSDQLSPAEERILEQVYEQYGAMEKWELRDFTHTLPEWEDPGPDRKRVRLRYRDVLRAGGWADDDIEDLIAVLTEEAAAARLLG